MDSQSEGGGGSLPGSPQSSCGRGTYIPFNPVRSAGCQQTTLNEEFKQPAAYLAKEKAPEVLCKAFQ